ncbi:MAG TPA: hypothetical protein PLX69_25160 [Leptospiraceae bacterium]|nr:hypothetical protein [Leptospiraceae bacterium]
MKTNSFITEKAHTDLLKVGARIQESKIYLLNRNFSVSKEDTVSKAFSEKWFGFKSQTYVKRLISRFELRFSKFPEAFLLLRSWVEKINLKDFKNICHFHIQLTDPYYRWFTGIYLGNLIFLGYEEIPTEALISSFEELVTTPMSVKVKRTLALRLKTAARDCGILEGKTDKKISLSTPGIIVLYYILFVLRQIGFPSSDIPSSPYIKSFYPKEFQFFHAMQVGSSMGYWTYEYAGNIFHYELKFSDWEGAKGLAA